MLRTCVSSTPSRIQSIAVFYTQIRTFKLEQWLNRPHRVKPQKSYNLMARTMPLVASKMITPPAWYEALKRVPPENHFPELGKPPQLANTRSQLTEQLLERIPILQFSVPGEQHLLRDQFVNAWFEEMQKGRTREDAFRITEAKFDRPLRDLMKYLQTFKLGNITITPDNFTTAWPRMVAEHRELRTMRRRSGATKKKGSVEQELFDELNSHYSGPRPQIDKEGAWTTWLRQAGAQGVNVKADRSEIAWDSFRSVKDDIEMMSAREKTEQAMLVTRLSKAGAEVVALFPVITWGQLQEHQDLQYAIDLWEESRDLLTDQVQLLKQITVAVPDAEYDPGTMIREAQRIVRKIDPKEVRQESGRLFLQSALAVDEMTLFQRYKNFLEVRKAIIDLQRALQLHERITDTPDNIIGYDDDLKPVYIGDRTQETPPTSRSFRERQLMAESDLETQATKLDRSFFPLFQLAAEMSALEDERTERKELFQELELPPNEEPRNVSLSKLKEFHQEQTRKGRKLSAQR